MDRILPKPTVVQKEDVANFSFPKTEVLQSAEDIRERARKIDRATTLGNIDHVKIKIIFEDNEAIKQVETTIWASTEKNIVLKKGVIIPVNRIHQIDLL
jgi:hypothetical protein